MRKKATLLRWLLMGTLLAALGIPGNSMAQETTEDCRKPLEPGPFLSDQEVVKIRVSYSRTGRARIEMLPPPGEAAVIHFINEGPKPLPGRPIAVRWEVSGLREGHTLYITPKRGSSREIFDFPEKRGEDPAFALKGGPRHDSLYSGEAQEEAFKRLYERAAADFKEGDEDRREAIYVSWFYNIEVVNKEGRQVGGIDPEVRVKKYP